MALKRGSCLVALDVVVFVTQSRVSSNSWTYSCLSLPGAGIPYVPSLNSSSSHLTRSLFLLSVWKLWPDVQLRILSSPRLSSHLDDREDHHVTPTIATRLSLSESSPSGFPIGQSQPSSTLNPSILIQEIELSLYSLHAQARGCTDRGMEGLRALTERVHGSAVLKERTMGIGTLMEMCVKSWGTHGWLDHLLVQCPTLAQACERTCQWQLVGILTFCEEGPVTWWGALDCLVHSCILLRYCQDGGRSQWIHITCLTVNAHVRISFQCLST